MKKRMTLRQARLRVKPKLTQTALAAKSGVNQDVICKIERGVIKSPSFAYGLALADALNVDPHRLQFGDEVAAS